MERITPYRAWPWSSSSLLPLLLAGCGGSKDENADANAPRGAGRGPVQQRRRCAERAALPVGHRPVQPGRAELSVFDLGGERPAHAGLHAVSAEQLHRRDRHAGPLHPAASGTARRGLCLLPAGALLLRADRRHPARPARHPAGDGRAAGGGEPLPRQRLCPRRAAEDRPLPRPSGRQGDGDRPLVREPASLRGGDRPVPARGGRLPDHQPRARGAAPADRDLPDPRPARAGAEDGLGAGLQLSWQRAGTRTATTTCSTAAWCSSPGHRARRTTAGSSPAPGTRSSEPAAAAGAAACSPRSRSATWC